MQRVCFVLRVRPEKIDEYRERHASVWPAMLEALRNAGWKNYSLFLQPDGMLIGYLETEDYQAALQQMQAAPINARWQQEMAPFFEELKESAADRSMVPLAEVFHLD